MLLEIAVFNYHSAEIAIKAGADRLELCMNYLSGGITPSYGLMKVIKEKINIPVYVMIRPRSGNFVYSNTEFEIMKQDILIAKQLGFEGVVLGLLKKNNTVDVERTKQLVTLANPMQVTFHRAFDDTSNQIEALEDIINCGCKRILTSGKAATAIQGKAIIKQLVTQAKKRIIILAGGGIRSNNIAELKKSTKAKEFHSAAISANELADAKEIQKIKILL
ncbi:MAG: copper homeostasis protein CutC [Bacteroidetes bacterium]|nr:copper homeostasis protein CutC [Bacteroidota bacterium]MBS1649639.1 copper homeostasis protein CutC [Bacteroidota bacterium]